MRIRDARLKPLLGLLLAASCAAPLHAQDAAEWGFYSASKHATRYSPLAQIDESNVARLRVVWRHTQADPAILAANPDLTLNEPLHGRRRSTSTACCTCRTASGLPRPSIPRRAARSGRRSRSSTAPEGLPSLMISKGVAYWGRGDEARILHGAPAASVRAESEDRRADRELRRRRQSRALDGRVPLQVERRARRRRRRRRRRLVDARAGFRRLQGRPARLRARVRRAHRQAALDACSPMPREGDPATATWQTKRGSTRAPATSGRRSASTRSSASCTCRRRASRTTCTAAIGSATTSTAARSLR